MKRQITLISLGNFPPVVGGIAHYLYSFAKYVPPDQLQVITTPAPGWQQFDQKQPFKVRRLNLPEKWYPYYRQAKYLSPWYLRELLTVDPPGMILCGLAHYSLMLPARIIQKFRGMPYGVFAHGHDLLRAQTRPYRPLLNALLRNAKIVFTNSTTTAKIAQDLSVRAERIFVINPVVDATKLTRSDIDAEDVRRKYGLPKKKCILTVGSLDERKGQDTVLKALPTILEQIPEAHYLIVGSGRSEQYLRSLVNDLGLSDSVTFAGRVADEELGAYYEASDVFVMISREIPANGNIEGFGIVYLEANLFGKPVVAGRSGGVEDAVIHGETGLLVDPHSSAEVSRAILDLLNNPEQAKHLGETGRYRVLRNFSGDVLTGKVMDKLSSLGMV